MQPPIDISALLRTALAEDIGSGDVTSMATIPAQLQAKFTMNARAEMVAAGLTFLPELFAMVVDFEPPHHGLEPGSQAIQKSPGGRRELSACTGMREAVVTITQHVSDGDKVAAGTRLATLSGPARALLSGERTALNLVQQLSGVATLTQAYVEAVAGTGAQILDTRKTIPGMRTLQKYAVRCGGGKNHRMGLYDAILIKDNHIAVAGGVIAAVNAARASSKLPIEVECDTLTQLDEALTAGVDSVLLDNMSNDQLCEAVIKVKAHNASTRQTVKTEASGNVSLETVRGIAETGVNYISVGKLTHSAAAVDIGLDEQN